MARLDVRLDVERRRRLDEHPTVSARDLVHAAVMQRLGSVQIISSDTDFEHLPAVTRLDPAEVESWRDGVLAGEDV